MKKILSCNLFIILFIIPILQGCAHLDANQAMGPKGTQSIFVYMCGSTLETKTVVEEEVIAYPVQQRETIFRALLRWLYKQAEQKNGVFLTLTLPVRSVI